MIYRRTGIPLSVGVKKRSRRSFVFCLLLSFFCSFYNNIHSIILSRMWLFCGGVYSCRTPVKFNLHLNYLLSASYSTALCLQAVTSALPTSIYSPMDAFDEHAVQEPGSIDSFENANSSYYLQQLWPALLLLVALLYFSDRFLRGSWSAGSTGVERRRVLLLDEARQKARGRQQEELERATAEHKKTNPTPSASTTSASTTASAPVKATSKPRPRPPSSPMDDGGYNPLLGPGGSASYRPSGFKKRGG
jgi:hypothetical protein